MQRNTIKVRWPGHHHHPRNRHQNEEEEPQRDDDMMITKRTEGGAIAVKSDSPSASDHECDDLETTYSHSLCLPKSRWSEKEILRDSILATTTVGGTTTVATIPGNALEAIKDFCSKTGETKARSASSSGAPTLPSRNRSVNDFASAQELQSAMESGFAAGTCQGVEPSKLFTDKSVLQELMSVASAPSGSACPTNASALDPKLDWVLENYHKETTRPQTVEEEMRRLLVLKSYLVLDGKNTATNATSSTFEDITLEAQQRFDCPIVLISLIDLGRQWFLSNRGLPEDVHETPRKYAFCAHCIQSKDDALIVPDATLDPRFQHNPLVTGPPDIRFYGGAPLIAPEGLKLGTLCVISPKPNHQFTDQDKDDLKQFAARTVQALVDHRKTMSLWFNSLASTRYPDLNANVDGDASDDHSSCSEKHHNAKEADEECNVQDKDVAMFLETTKRMPLKDLLSLLQDHAIKRRLCSATEELSIDKSLQETPATATTITAVPSSPSARPPKKPKRRAFVHFAMQHEIRHTVENWRDLKQELWWSPQDMRYFKREARNAVQFYRQYKPEYIDSIQIIAKGGGAEVSSPEDMETHMKNLTEEDFPYPPARGLELFIDPFLLGTARDQTLDAVLMEQSACQDRGDDYETTSSALRSASRACGRFSIGFAHSIAQGDRTAAVKASMCRWRTSARWGGSEECANKEQQPRRPVRLDASFNQQTEDENCVHSRWN